jgi:hypothetical protein
MISVAYNVTAQAVDITIIYKKYLGRNSIYEDKKKTKDGGLLNSVYEGACGISVSVINIDKF